MSREDLAQQLKIERDRPPRRRRRGEGGGRLGLIVAISAVVIALAAGGVWFLIARPDLTEVETADAKAAWSGAAQSSTLLDASG
jgi:hypothetical protein